MTDTSVAYDAFISQLAHNVDTADTQALAAAVTSGQVDEVMTVVRSVVADAAGKAKMLFLGSPSGTILRNKVTKASATRAIDAAGIPVWRVALPDGSKWDSHEPVLEPEADWVCIYNPETAGD